MGILLQYFHLRTFVKARTYNISGRRPPRALLYKNEFPVKTIVKHSTRSVKFMPVVYRGEIYYADLSPVVGSEQGGIRPVLIVQNDVGNKHSPTVIAAAITSRQEKTRLPTHIEIDSQSCGLAKDSVVLLEQIRTIDKKRLKERMGTLDSTAMDKINNALSISFGLT